MLGLRISPVQIANQETTDLVISLFFPYLSPPKTEESSADEVALQVFLRGLQHTDHRLRVAACEALGQLGNLAARDALLATASEEDLYVRVAAARALSVLDAPRGRKEDLAGVRLLLWQQVRHLWKPLATVTTDQCGRARFRHTPVAALYRMQLLDPVQPRQNTFSVQLSPAFKSGELAAEDSEASSESFPYLQQTTLESGNLLCSMYRNDQEEVVVEFRSDALQLRDGWIHFWAINRETQQETVNAFVALEPDRHGVLTARLVLSNIMDFQQEHEFHFEPLIKPG
jgi:hypothetical protein